ncbi:MAG: hypothetical protein FWG20_07205 [Candidatus Cloacimonetes bacterium]|nr:hypothetical protein [Candidatus Cloacimonadota bacterium]
MIQEHNSCWMKLCVISWAFDNPDWPTPKEASNISGLFIDDKYIDRISNAYYSQEEYEDMEVKLKICINKTREDIIRWYNQEFIRIRYGGKYRFKNDGIIYFKISSDNFDWTYTIQKFCKDNFGVNSDQYIWVGLDADTKTKLLKQQYFEGAVKDLLFDLENEVWSASKFKRRWE